MSIQQNVLNSEERFWSLGFWEKTKIFWKINEDTTSKPFAPNIVCSWWFNLSLDVVNHSRTIYGIFDFLGDVGGLLDLFRLFAEIIIALFAWLVGSNLQFFLIANLFKTKPNSS